MDNFLGDCIIAIYIFLVFVLHNAYIVVGIFLSIIQLQ